MRSKADGARGVRWRNKILFPYQTVLPSARRDSTYNGADFPAYFTFPQYLDLSLFLASPCREEEKGKKKVWAKKGRDVSLASFFPYNELSIKFHGTGNISRLSHVRWKCCIDLRVGYKTTDCTSRLSRESREIIEKQTRGKERSNGRYVLYHWNRTAIELMTDYSCALECFFSVKCTFYWIRLLID